MKKYAILFILLFHFTVAFSQLSFCTGSKGAPIFFEDFGSGSNYGPALGAGITNYTYVDNGFPNDGSYTLFNRTNLIPNNWLYSLDHTPDNQLNGLNGKCLIVNAKDTPGEFYKKTVINLCSNTTFEFSAWVMNIYNAASGGCAGTGIPINISFEIWDPSNMLMVPLQSGSTGNINGTSTPNWNQFGLVFTMPPGKTSVILIMKNIGSGGCGNDLAIDDIMFRACGEFSQISNTGNTQNNINICQNQTITNNALNISTTGTAPNVYQWQQSTDAINYTDIAGETSTTYNIPAVASTTYYRVKVANDISNLSNPFCTTLSEIFTVNVNPAPSPPISNGDKTLCSNQSTTISVTAGTNENINWYDAATNGLLLSNAAGFTSANAGTYYAEAINTLTGCKSGSRTAVKLLPKTTVSFTGTTTICSSETTALALSCSDTTALFNWTANSTNATGFSNGTGNAIQQTLIATGASQGTVIYTITPTVNGCEGTTQTITVSVNTQATVTPTFGVFPTSFCKNATAPTLPTSSTNSTPIAGTWNPPTITTSAIGNSVYTFIPQPNACINYTPISKTITITDNVIPNFNANLTICSGTTPPLLGPTSPNGIVGTWLPPTIDNSVSKSYEFTPNGGQCAVTQTINVVVNSNNSTVDIAGNTTICSTETTLLTLTTADSNVTFKWKATSTNVTGFSNGTGTTIQQTLTAIGTAPGTVIYTVTPILNGCEGTPTVAIVTVNTLTNITPTFDVIPTTFCENAVPSTLPLLSTNSTPIAGTWNPTTINTSSVGNTIYTFVPTPNACVNYAPYTITITILDNFLPDFEDAISFCLGANPPQLPLISPVGITGTWNPSVIDNQVSSSYIFTPDGSQCALPQTINVSVFKPTLTSVTCTTSVAFSENQMITVLATDIGDYLYQLDNGVFQEDNVFYNVTAGYHKVTVMDKNGCSPSLSENVIAINYPKYFTPNGDNINDVWSIKGLSNLKNVEMTVFDRSGKAIAALTPSSLGWDGKFNGADLPSDDYWFVIHFVENNVPRTFRSHFSLKR